MLDALKQAWEPIFVDYPKGVIHNMEWRESVNGIGEVPVLDDGNRRLTQSDVILNYLSKNHSAFEEESQDESGYEMDVKFKSIATWLERVCQIPEWVDPYEIFPAQ